MLERMGERDLAKLIEILKLALAGKSPTGHKHAASEIDGLSAAITGFVKETTYNAHVADTSKHFGINPTANVNGTLYRGTAAPTGTERLNYSGYFQATRVYGSYYSDYAEFFNVVDDAEPGDVVAVCGANEFAKCPAECSPCAVGVVSDEYYMCVGHVPGRRNVPVALSGKVHVKVCGDVRPGDTLVAGAIPGTARALHAGERAGYGAIIGQALEAHEGMAVGRVLMLVMHR